MLKKEQLIHGALYKVEARTYYQNVALWTGNYFIGFAGSCGFIYLEKELYWNDDPNYGTCKPLEIYNGDDYLKILIKIIGEIEDYGDYNV